MPSIDALEYSLINYGFKNETPNTYLLDKTLEHNNCLDLQKCSWRIYIHRAMPWFLAFLFGMIALFLFLERSTSSVRMSEAGFVTEFSKFYFLYLLKILTKALDHQAVIPLQNIQFTGSPHFYHNGTSWRQPINQSLPWPENVQYFGEPSPEVDANWDKLIGGRYFSLSEEEAIEAWGEKYHEYVDELLGGYTAGLVICCLNKCFLTKTYSFEMFHTLHCVVRCQVLIT